jgi:DNA repair photolyase
VPNPFCPDQCSLVSLLPEDVDCLVFWTRYPVPLLRHLPELASRGFRWYFLYTLLDYPAALEPHAPPLERRLDALRAAASTVPHGVVWRYDPIILSRATPVSFHIETFARLAQALEGTIERVVISFLSLYRKVACALAELENDGFVLATEPELSREAPQLARRLAEEAQRHGMQVQSCAEKHDLSPFGVKAGKCIDDQLILRLFGITVSAAKDPGQRKACRCVESRDIGSYGTCLFGCRYCYATAPRREA